MMGRLKSDQSQLFYEFHLGDAVPEDHLVRKIDAALDLSWLRGELAPHYSSIGRDLSPKVHPAMGGILFSFEPVRLGDATGRGAEPSTQRSVPSCCITDAVSLA